MRFFFFFWGGGGGGGLPFCAPLVYSLGALCSFFIYILLFTDQKKKKRVFTVKSMYKAPRIEILLFFP